jgi:excisionase family DNA binding protein
MNNVEVKEKLLSVKAVADILSVSRRTVHRLNSAGKLPKSIRINGSVRWRESDIVEWIGMGCPDRTKFETTRGEN